MAMADEDGIDIGEAAGRYFRRSPPERPRDMTKDRIGEKARSRHLDQDGRVTQEGYALTGPPARAVAGRRGRASAGRNRDRPRALVSSGLRCRSHDLTSPARCRMA